MSSVFNPLVDRMLRLDRGDRIAWLDAVKHGLATFPELASVDQRELMRRIAKYDVFNRLAFRLETQLSGLAIFLARFVPIDGAYEAFKSVPKDRPIMLALTHFGPVHFVVTVLMPALRGRKVYVMHAGGDTAHAVARFMLRIGATPIVNDDNALRKLTTIIAQDPGCAIVYAFDYMASRGRRPLMILGKAVSIGRSVAFLADVGNTAVFTAIGNFSLGGVRVALGGPYELDMQQVRSARQEDLMRRLYDVVEARLRVAPEQWTEWYNCAQPAALEKPTSPEVQY